MKIAISGAAGRVGRHIVRAVVAHPEAELVAALEAPGHPKLGQDVGIVSEAGVELDLVLSSDLGAALSLADALIDFSVPQGTAERVDAAAAAGVAVVVGTTGLDAGAKLAFERAADRVAVVASPNMSVGINVLLSLLREASRLLGPDYDFEIFELHHSGKVDSPSGTALRMAEVVAKERGHELGIVGRHGRSGALGKRPRDEIGLHAARGGDAVGDHTAIFAGGGERIELIHRAHSRDTFAHGALRAALWTAGRAPGLYDMSDVLGGGRRT